MSHQYRPGDEPIPGFRVVELIGRGGFGEVWKAVAPGGTQIALKIMSLENKQGYKEFRAFKAIQGVRHPHLVPIAGLWLKDTSGRLYEEGSDADSLPLDARASELIIAMGLGDKNLLDRLRECQAQGLPGIPMPELLDYMEETAKAIDFLNRATHNVGGSDPIAIQHCDIKPQNILVVGGATQVGDFGLTRVLGDARLTQISMSAPYTPPEMITTSKPSGTSDQYSLAITYVELRTGNLPFEQSTPAGMMWAHVQGKLDLSRLPPAEQAVIQRATALEPTRRFASTFEMVRELRRAYEGISSSRTGTPSKTGKVADKLQAGDEIVPGYKLVRLLGRGGYGSVWETQAPGGKLVALKIIGNLEGSPDRQEFKALELIKTLEHNHLLELHAYWLLDKDGAIIPDEVRRQPGAPPASTLVIATKLASKNLLQRLHECQQAGNVGIPALELHHYMRQAALAIDYLNSAQHPLEGRLFSIQHGNIKPENLLLAREGTLKVGDFGQARLLEGSSASLHRDSTGYTPFYAAPELFNNQVTLWTDQYALALTYYKLRTGALPFDENASLYDLMMTHMEGRLDLSKVPAAERDVLARATSVDPSKRYPSTLEMVHDLREGATGQRPPAEVAIPEILPFGGGYKLIKRLGSRGFGEVWEAEASAGVRVAIRIINRPIDAEASQRELQVLELIKRLRHPHILQTLSYWSSNDRLYVIMELAEGDLRMRLTQCQEMGLPGIPAAELLAYYREAAEGVDYLHFRGILHRDLKPDKLLLSLGHIKVAGAGLLGLMENAQQTTTTSAGTPAYMAPEIWAGTPGPQSDLYSLAASYVELRFGRQLFPTTNLAQLMLSHIEQQPDLSSFPPVEREVLSKALAKDPNQRYSSCRDFVEALEKGIDGDSATPQSPPALEATWRAPEWFPQIANAHEDDLGETSLYTMAPPETRPPEKPVSVAAAPPASAPQGAGPSRRKRLPEESRSSGAWKSVSWGVPLAAKPRSRVPLAIALWVGVVLMVGAANLWIREGVVLFLVVPALAGLALVFSGWVGGFFTVSRRPTKAKWTGTHTNRVADPRILPEHRGEPPPTAGKAGAESRPAPGWASPFVEAEAPYVVGRPVQGDLFVGRRDILKMVKDNLTPEAGKNILVLRGQRRTGKTSVLLRLRDTLARESNGFYLPAFIDVQGLALVQNEGQFLHLLTHQICSGLKRHDVEVPKPDPAEFNQAPLMAFELGFLEKVKGTLGHRQILLMLDEFEMLKGLIESQLVSDKILDYFRHLMQHSPLLFLIAGTQKLRELTGGYWSVFFNLAIVIDMGTLDEDAARWLITEPVRPWYAVERAAVEEIVRVAGCHPYFTQLVCKKLLEVRNEQKLNRVGLGQVRLAVHRTLESGDEQIGYPWTEEDCSPAERLVMSALAEELGETGTAAARDTLFTRLVEVCNVEVAAGPTIDRLRIRGVLREDEAGGLAFVVPLFQSWLIRKSYDTLETAHQYNREHARA